MVRDFALKALLVVSVLIAVPATSVRGAEQDDTDAGWVNLVSDNLADHWTTEGNWSLNDDGVISITPREGEQGWRRFHHYLWSKKQYGDFEFEVDFKVDPEGNSGFYFHVGNVKNPVHEGIEVQILDSHDHSTLNDHDCGGIIPGIPPTQNAARPAGEWNRYQITCKDGKVTVLLNGKTVNEVVLADSPVKGRPAKGFLGFQDHGLRLWLRNIRVREL